VCKFDEREIASRAAFFRAHISTYLFPTQEYCVSILFLYTCISFPREHHFFCVCATNNFASFAENTHAPKETQSAGTKAFPPEERLSAPVLYILASLYLLGESYYRSAASQSRAFLSSATAVIKKNIPRLLIQNNIHREK